MRFFKTKGTFLVFLFAFCPIIFFGLVSKCQAATRVISPSGSGSTCSASSPCSWSTAYSASASGDTIQLRGGTYRSTYSIEKAITVQNYAGEAPVIDGERIRPGAQYGSLIVVRGSGATIDGLKIINSTNMAVTMQYATNATIKNSIFDACGEMCILSGLPGVDNHNLIENVVVTRGNYCWVWGTCGEWASIQTNISLAGNYNTVRNSIIAYGAMTGVEGYQDKYSTIENNIIYGSHLNQIHVAKTTAAIIRRNLIYGTAGVDGRKGHGKGISIGVEDWYDGTGWDYGHEIYGNLVANTEVGISLHSDTGQFDWSYPNRLKDCKIYNNTSIDGFYNGDSWTGHAFRILDSEFIGTGNVVKNNIFWQSSGDVSYGYASPSKFIFSNNLWNKIPGSSFRSSSDSTASLYTSNPSYSLNITDYFQKTSGWTSLTADSLTGQEFALRSTASYAIGKGTNLGAPYNELLKLSEVNFINKNFPTVTQPANWDLGAGPYSGSSVAVCGNGVVETGEQCDLGSSGNGSCPKTCSATCTANSCGAVCGNLICDSGETYSSCPADCPNGTLIPNTNWTCTADSEETSAIDGRCRNAFDNDVSTSWHTAWTSSSPLQPHNIDINLGGTYQVSGLRYIPRQVDGTNGIVTQYEIYSSNDGNSWTFLRSGTWSYSAKEAKDITIAPRTVRHIRFKSLEDNSHHWTSAAEIILIGGTGDTTAPNAPGGLSVR